MSALVRRVCAWYGTHARPLPWRAPGTSPWGVLVSEFMCQQTQVDRVIPRWTSWIATWPRPSDLAAAPVADAIRAWDRLGYPRRAKWLHQAAVEIAEQHGDAVPNDHAALRALTGVGEYTAAAVQAFAFGESVVVLDTNVRRVLARAIEGEAIAAPGTTNAERSIGADLVGRAGAQGAVWSQAVMELGAQVCTARAPNCDACPIRGQCAWRRAGYPESTRVTRRPAAYAGSDRQARGRVLAALRESQTSVPASAIEDLFSDLLQRDRAVDTLIADGLIVRTAVGDYRLP